MPANVPTDPSSIWPSGMKPMKTIVFTLMTRPRIASGVRVCIRVFAIPR